jgi:hypothetical protein
VSKARQNVDKLNNIVDAVAYGVKADGVTNNAVALQAAIDAVSSGGVVVLPRGTISYGTTLVVYGTVTLQGQGRAETILSYTGAAQGIKQSTPSTRIYDVSVRDLTLLDAGTGTIGLDMASVSSGVFENLLVDGFTTAVSLTGSNGFCVYNRFYNVTAANATTGFAIGGAGSNSNTFLACRANVCTTGFNIADSNQNQITHCQIEAGVTGIQVSSTTNALSDRNTFSHNRFEGNSGPNVYIAKTSGNAYVRETALFGNHYADAASKIISAATSANPIVLTTSVAHTWSSGHQVRFEDMPGDFAALNGVLYEITVLSTTTFSVAVDGSGYGAYTPAGASAERARVMVTDGGTRTFMLDPFGTTGPNLKITSANTAVSTGTFEFERSVSGGSSLPAMVVRDSNTGSGTPVTVQAETGRSTGSFFKGVRAGATYFEAYANGALAIRDGITAPAAVTDMALIYVDTADGDLKVRFSDGTIKTIVVDT